MKRRWYVLLGMVALTMSHAVAREICVAPGGDDADPGTKEKPLRTLEAARDTLRKQRTSGEAATVWLAGGTYVRTETFELDGRDSHTTYRSHTTDKADASRIIGGRDIPASAAKPVTDKAVLARIVESAARPKILQVDLKALGITDYGELGPRGFRRYYIPAPLELYIDGKPMQVARWPNAGERHVPMGRVHDKGSNPRKGDYSFRPGTFEYGVNRPTLWTKATDLYVSGLFCYGYADDTIKVAKLDAEKGTFTTTHPHLYGFVKHSFCSWYALNLLEEIDVPGEYYVDKAAGVLYFYPPGSFTASSRLSVSLLDEPMVAIEGARGIRFDNLVFEVTRGSGFYIERGASNEVAACTLRNMGIVAVQMGKGIKPFPYGKHDACGNKADGKPGVPASRRIGSWHEHIYRFTAWDREAGTGHRIAGCDIHDLGAGGVLLGGGDRKTLTAGGNTVANCDIYRVNRWDRTYKAPINVDGVGNVIRNNHLHDCEGMAIYLHGNDHIVEYNEIDHVCTDISDQGSIYMGRDPSEAGSVFRYNYFHDILNFHEGGHGVQAIFFDDCSICGAEIYGNVFYRTGNTGAIKFNGGGACRIHNNVFVDGPRPVQGAGNNTGRVRGFMKGPMGQERLRQRVDITKPPYAGKYPLLLAIYEGREPVTTPFERNYVVKGDYAAFVDAKGGDFRLKEDAKVFTEIPGFNPIPFEKIGLRVDETRRTLPVGPPAFEKGSEFFVGGMRVGLIAPLRAAHVVYTLDGSEPTAGSPRYTAPIPLTATTRVKARAIGAGEKPAMSETVSRRFVRVVVKPMRNVRINFQPLTAPKPMGYLIDSGRKFHVLEGGSAFGWSADNRDATRERGKHDDPLRDTLIHFSEDYCWEIAVVNATYELTICVGDAEHPSVNQTIFAEDEEFCAKLDLKGAQFKIITKTVRVKDGLLTLHSRNVQHGPELTRMNWLTLRAVGP